MAVPKLVAVKEFCIHHNISSKFIDDLYHNEIIELVIVKKTGYIPEKNLHSLERIIRLYHDLNINIEGIQTILQLLSVIEKKETELSALRNQLAFYSSEW